MKSLRQLLLQRSTVLWVFVLVVSIIQFYGSTPVASNLYDQMAEIFKSDASVANETDAYSDFKSGELRGRLMFGVINGYAILISGIVIFSAGFLKKKVALYFLLGTSVYYLVFVFGVFSKIASFSEVVDFYVRGLKYSGKINRLELFILYELFIPAAYVAFSVTSVMLIKRASQSRVAGWE